jgi:hypothetical protein
LVPDPPVAAGEIVDAWPKSTGLGAAVGVPATNVEPTINVNVAIAVFPFPSVTVSVTVNGDPVAAVGVQPMDGESVLEQPVGRFVHT